LLHSYAELDNGFKGYFEDLIAIGISAEGQISCILTVGNYLIIGCNIVIEFLRSHGKLLPGKRLWLYVCEPCGLGRMISKLQQLCQDI
jgi:hypothetical protein